MEKHANLHNFLYKSNLCTGCNKIVVLIQGVAKLGNFGASHKGNLENIVKYFPACTGCNNIVVPIKIIQGVTKLLSLYRKNIIELTFLC